jgi:thiol-disulfide isomerase/thioredoxin
MGFFRGRKKNSIHSFLVSATCALIGTCIFMETRYKLKNRSLDMEYRGTSLPELVIQDLGRNDVSINSSSAQRVFIDFWETWCAPCRAEFPKIQQLYESHGELVDFYIINRGQDRETVQDFLKKEGYTFPVYLDRLGDAYGKFPDEGIPLTIVAEAGKIEYIHCGRLSDKELEEIVNRPENDY